MAGFTRGTASTWSENSASPLSRDSARTSSLPGGIHSQIFFSEMFRYFQEQLGLPGSHDRECAGAGAAHLVGVRAAPHTHPLIQVAGWRKIFEKNCKNICSDMTGTGGRTLCSARSAFSRTTSSSTSRTSSRRRRGWPQSSGRRISSRPGQDTILVLSLLTQTYIF